jgi:hypothetical protein
MRGALLLSAVALFCCVGCERPQAVSSSMPKNEQEGLRTGLQQLEATLREKSPFIADALAPPATDDQLKMLWAELGGAQIECLETWYRWHNGCTSPTIDLIPLGRMLSIDEAINNRKQIQSILIIDSKLRGAYKILEDLAGDGFYLDVASPNPQVFYCMIEDPYPRYFGSLSEFIGFIESVHTAGLATKDEHGVDFDFQPYQELEAAYLQSVGSE